MIKMSVYDLADLVDCLDLGLEELYLQVFDLFVFDALAFFAFCVFGFLLEDLGLQGLEGDFAHYKGFLTFLQLALIHLHFLDQSHLFLVFQLGPFPELEVLDLHLSHAAHLHLYLLVQSLLLFEQV